jgi:hypothetical protein
MSAVRQLTSKLLRGLLRHSSLSSNEWAIAMLRELDFVESDGAAIFWAIGCLAAIFKFSVRQSCFRLGDSGRRKDLMNGIVRRALGALSGVAIAGVLAICAFGLLQLSFRFFPSFAERTPWLPWLTLIAMPIAAFILAAVALSRNRRSIAVGILLLAIPLGTHFAMHLATHASD